MPGRGASVEGWYTTESPPRPAFTNYETDLLGFLQVVKGTTAGSGTF